jgi:hypothetical protein
MVQNDYGIKRKGTSVRNPQANAILERIHQTIANMIRTFQIQDSEIDKEDPWAGILAATMFATRATYHTTLQATPSQLVFGRDAILNIPYHVDWQQIKLRKQKLIHENNQRENSKRLAHIYHVGDKVLYNTESETKAKFGEDPWKGPYKIVKVNDNGTVRLKMGIVTDTINIRLIKPYNT